MPLDRPTHGKKMWSWLQRYVDRGQEAASEPLIYLCIAGSPGARRMSGLRKNCFPGPGCVSLRKRLAGETCSCSRKCWLAFLCLGTAEAVQARLSQLLRPCQQAERAVGSVLLLVPGERREEWEGWRQQQSGWKSTKGPKATETPSLCVRIGTHP